MDIPIVVVAYNRPDSLNRLLESLARAKYGGRSVDLIISIDKSINNSVIEVAKNFKWKNGNKKIILHDENLGLKMHVLKCGDLALKFEAIIMLEDDLVVSPAFYEYAQASVSFYQDDLNIAGISLYTYRVTEFSNLRSFIPLQDGHDTYFAQVPSSWGQIWTKIQWKNFKHWYDNNNYLDVDISELIPEKVQNWPESSWKKKFHIYLAQNNKYFVYPRIALSTNMGEAGTHNYTASNAHQSILLGSNQMSIRFAYFNNLSSIKYDAFLENINIKEVIMANFPDKKIEIDYYGIKKKTVSNCFLLSVEKLNFVIVKKWALSLVPYELNILYDIKGEGIYLYDTSLIKINTNNMSSIKRIMYETPNITRSVALKFIAFDYCYSIKYRLSRIFRRR